MNHHTEEYLEEELVEKAHAKVGDPVRNSTIPPTLTHQVDERASQGQSQKRGRDQSDQEQVLREDWLVSAQEEERTVG